jgi:hypothetical protein
MQKISSYLYPNRINVVADVAIESLASWEHMKRWNIVYQNKVKIYQGVDNLITLDVKNSDQKRIDISDMTLKMSITDVNGIELTTVDATLLATTGLATVNIPASTVAHLDPQFLSFTIYNEITNEDDTVTRTVMYADTQFGAVGNMELVGSAIPVGEPPRYITRFIKITNDLTDPYTVQYFSDAVEIRKNNFLNLAADDEVFLDFKLLALEGSITVQYTKDDIVSSSITWTDLEVFSVAASTAELTKSYANPIYQRDWTWLRVVYTRATNNTGSIDLITIRM